MSVKRLPLSLIYHVFDNVQTSASRFDFMWRRLLQVPKHGLEGKCHIGIGVSGREMAQREVALKY